MSTEFKQDEEERKKEEKIQNNSNPMIIVPILRVERPDMDEEAMKYLHLAQQGNEEICYYEDTLKFLADMRSHMASNSIAATTSTTNNMKTCDLN